MVTTGNMTVIIRSTNDKLQELMILDIPIHLKWLVVPIKANVEPEVPQIEPILLMYYHKTQILIWLIVLMFILCRSNNSSLGQNVIGFLDNTWCICTYTVTFVVETLMICGRTLTE